MRIAICSDIYLPQLSGVADSIEQLAITLRTQGNDVELFAPSITGMVPDPLVHRLPSFAIPGSGGGLVLVFPFGLYHALKIFKPDVIHVHTFSTVGCAALFAGWRLNIPVVGTDHTSPADYLHYFKMDYALIRSAIRTFASKFHGACTAITAPSQHILDELSDYGMRNVPAQIISNPVDQNFFRPLHGKKNELKEKYNARGFTVALFGRIAIEKNLAFSVDVLAKFAQKFPLSIILLGDGPYREELQKKIRDAGLEGATRYAGVLRGEALVEALNAADVHLVTSTSEIQPMTILQAMACGLPVIGARAGGIRECIEDDATGYLVDPTDTEGYVARLIQLMENPGLRAVFGEAGRAAVRGYQPSIIAEKFSNVYAIAISKKTRL